MSKDLLENTTQNSNTKKETLLYKNAQVTLPTTQTVSETAISSGIKRQGEYTLADYYAFPDDRRVELIDGVIYDMAAPGLLHQRICGEIFRQIANHITDKKGACIPFIAPVDVQLDCDDKTMVQPDIGILCDINKYHENLTLVCPAFLCLSIYFYLLRRRFRLRSPVISL